VGHPNVDGGFSTIGELLEHYSGKKRRLPSKTERPALLKLGQDIVKTQSAEIQQMQSWQRQWFNRERKD